MLGWVLKMILYSHLLGISNQLQGCRISFVIFINKLSMKVLKKKMKMKDSSKKERRGDVKHFFPFTRPN